MKSSLQLVGLVIICPDTITAHASHASTDPYRTHQAHSECPGPGELYCYCAVVTVIASELRLA